ncbi:MAG: mobile mystery protein A [Gammaproteobacteria bacterium]|nr:mobile mystery protein A [Gammaproteobacteria bacterium]
MNTRNLERKQLSEKLIKMSKAINMPRPIKGWIKAIRTALEMTSTQLAKRLGVDQSQVIKLEQAEASDTITLKSLRKVANALDCEFVYALVPRTSLEVKFEQQIDLVAKRRFSSLQHNMELEKQGLSEKSQKRQLKELRNIMLKNPPKKLWEEKGQKKPLKVSHTVMLKKPTK